MSSHRLQDHLGKWHRVVRSTGRPGAYVTINKHGEPMRLWLPGQFNSKTVEVIR